MTKVQYAEAGLAEVMRYFAKDYRGDVAHELTEWFIDPVKGKVVFKLYVRVEESK